MKITNEQSSLEQYAVISYSHADTDAVMAELGIYDKNGMCYWYDEEMDGGESYRTQFREKLNHKNCRGIIYFISESFILSPSCADEIKYFSDSYAGKSIEDPDKKFCFFVLPKNFPVSGTEDVAVNKKHISSRVKDHFRNEHDLKKKAFFDDVVDELGKHIDWYLELSKNSTSLYGIFGNDGDYVGRYCSEGKIFSKIISGVSDKQASDRTFGYFPQKENKKRVEASNMDKKLIERNLDKKPAYYAPVEWMVIKENEQSQTLLSKELLFAIDYMDLKYPFLQTDKAIEERIREIFLEYFETENDKKKIKKVRLLTKDELDKQLNYCRKEVKRKREILMPKPTFFAQISNRKDAPAFWLAGDMDDARWVDAATESLSEQQAGVEQYYVRIVIEVEK